MRPHKTEPSSTKRQAVTFLFVGGLNTLFGYGLYAFFIYLGMPYQLAAFASTCLGVLFNFKTTGKIVFQHSGQHVFLKFLSVYLFLYLLNVTLIKLIHMSAANLYLAGFLAIAPLAVVSFLLNKHIVFKERYETH